MAAIQTYVVCICYFLSLGYSIVFIREEHCVFYVNMSQEKHSSDAEAAICQPENEDGPVSAFQQLGILDRFLAVWIFLAMAVGIILGNFVPNTREALEKGKFVGVSVPIGKFSNSLYRRLIS